MICHSLHHNPTFRLGIALSYPAIQYRLDVRSQNFHILSQIIFKQFRIPENTEPAHVSPHVTETRLGISLIQLLRQVFTALLVQYLQASHSPGSIGHMREQFGLIQHHGRGN